MYKDLMESNNEISKYVFLNVCIYDTMEGTVVVAYGVSYQAIRDDIY